MLCNIGRHDFDLIAAGVSDAVLGRSLSCFSACLMKMVYGISIDGWECKILKKIWNFYIADMFSFWTIMDMITAKSSAWNLWLSFLFWSNGGQALSDFMLQEFSNP